MDDLESFRATTTIPVAMANNRSPVRKTTRKFLRGPIPWDWLTRAALLPMPTILVALELWRESGCRSSRRDIALSTAKLQSLGVARKASYAAIKHLEASKLVTVERQSGRLSRLTILDIEPTR